MSDMPRRGDCAPAASGRGTPGSAWQRVPEEGRRVPAWSKLGRGAEVRGACWARLPHWTLESTASRARGQGHGVKGTGSRAQGQGQARRLAVHLCVSPQLPQAWEGPAACQRRAGDMWPPCHAPGGPPNPELSLIIPRGKVIGKRETNKQDKMHQEKRLNKRQR